MNRSSKWILAWAVVVTGFFLMGMGSLHTFSPNTVISSADVNQNFADVKAAIDTLETQMAAQPGATSQGVWHVYNLPTPIHAMLTTSPSNILHKTLTTTTPEDAVLRMRLDGMADVPASAGVTGVNLTIRISPVDGTGTVSDAQINLTVANGQTFAAIGNVLTYAIPLGAFTGTYDVNVDASVTGSGGTTLSLNSLHLRFLVLERTKTVDPSPNIP
jgi:hypothetical protein